MSKVEHTRMSSSSSCDESAAKENAIATTSTTATTTSPAVASNGDTDATASRFAGAGVDFKGKLIGIEEVAEARGDKMCQVAMAKLKAGVRAIGEHKQRITINVSLEGIQVIDEKTTEILHRHEVSRISFIARDPSDSRAFGYVYKKSDSSHQFFGIKTEKAAEGLVLSLRDLFQTVYDLKKKQLGETPTPNKETNNNEDKNETEQPKETIETKPEETTASKSSTDIMDLFDANPSESSSELKKVNQVDGLSPTLKMLDPWGSNSTNLGGAGIPGMTQPSGAFSSAALFQQPLAATTNIGNPIFFPQVVQPVAMVPGSALLTTSGPVGSGGGSVYPTAAVIWPTSTLTSGPAPGAVPPGGQRPWGPFGGPLPTAGLAGAGAADPFGSVSPAGFQQPSSQQPLAGSQAPLIPARRTSPPASNPFAADQFNPTPVAAASKKADPFAALDVLGSVTAQSQPYGKKVDKKDFFQEQAKPSLFDLTQQQQTVALQQQQQQQIEPVRDLFGAMPFPNTAAINDPFA